MATFLVLLSTLMFVGSLFSFLFKRFRWKGAWVTLGSVVIFFVAAIMGGQEIDEKARQNGFSSAADARSASDAGVTDPAEWRSRREAKEKAAAQALALANAEKANAERRKADLLKPPANQLAFMSAIKASRKQYAEGSNELQRGAARPARARAICSVVQSPTIEGWIGKIVDLSTNGDGEAVISVSIDKNLRLKTWNNSVSDAGDRTLIKSGSQLYNTLLRMKPGEIVRVSGSLLMGGPDCYKESSVTLAGSLEEPEFLMRFSRVVAVNAQ